MTLLETYSKRINIAEQVFSQKNNGARLSDAKKIALATVLNNTSKFLTEAFNNSVGTQRSDMGQFKKFSLNLTTVTLPNLIASDLVIVHPMTSLSGYINYIQFVKGTDKGTSSKGDLVNDPFKLGTVDVNYTGPIISETHEVTSAQATAHSMSLVWSPVVAVSALKVGNAVYTVITEGTPVADKSALLDTTTGTLTFATADTNFVAGANVAALYSYDNEIVPQNDIPVLNAKMATMPLVAHGRRIAVYYSQLAAYQAKQDYGFDLGDQLAEQAVAELSYEIDTEVTQLLIDYAEEPTDGSTKFNKVPRVGVDIASHYAGFAETITNAAVEVYNRTKKHMPNYMLISSFVLPVLKYVPGFKAAPIGNVNGCFYAGQVDQLKVFVTPNIDANYFVIGVNGTDMRASAAVYAPYMAIVPTQLLQYNDGGTTQGWSTLYDLRILSTYTSTADSKEYSPLLVKGHIYSDESEIKNTAISNKPISA